MTAPICPLSPKHGPMNWVRPSLNVGRAWPPHWRCVRWPECAAEVAWTMPTSVDEYNILFKQSYHLEGSGSLTRVHFPCYLCAAPDFLVCRLLDLQDEMQGEHKCLACQRTVQAIVTEHLGARTVRLILVDGPEAAPWMPLERPA